MAYTTVEGKVTRTFYEGKGAEVIETFTVKGKEISKRWAVWFQEPHGLVEGDNVKVAGLHSDELNSWNDKETGEAKQSVKRSLNGARLLESSPAVPYEPQTSGDPDAEPWNSTDTPF